MALAGYTPVALGHPWLYLGIHLWPWVAHYYFKMAEGDHFAIIELSLTHKIFPYENCIEISQFGQKKHRFRKLSNDNRKRQTPHFKLS